METPRAIKEFVGITDIDVAYKLPHKELFHKRAKSALRRIAKDLGMESGEYNIRSNKGGIAVSGEITLHSDTLYIQFFQSVTGPSAFLYRNCAGRKDYQGGTNRWMHFSHLLNYQDTLLEFKRVMQKLDTEPYNPNF